LTVSTAASSTESTAPTASCTCPRMLWKVVVRKELNSLQNDCGQHRLGIHNMAILLCGSSRKRQATTHYEVGQTQVPEKSVR
jgi:hypothetical protein